MDYLNEYERRFAADPATADRSLLTAAAAEVEARLAAGTPSADLVHAAHRVYTYVGNGEAIVDLLTRYLRRPLPTDEEAWARWELVDQLAVLSRCDEAVRAQQEFLDWARRTMPVDQLLWVMSDGTQALCWLAVGRHEEWFEIFEELLRSAAPVEANREDRLYYLRTAGILLASLRRTDNALAIARTMRAVAAEDPEWGRAFWARLESRVVQLHSYQAAGDLASLRRVGAAIATLLHEEYRQLERGQSDLDAVTLRTLYHNTAAPLYRAGEYEAAIPLFQRAIALGAAAPQAYLWLAACLWVTTGDRARVRELLIQAAARLSPSEWRLAVEQLPELPADIVEDLRG